MDCVISTELYNAIKELTIKGDLKSFEFYYVNKGLDTTINEIYNNKKYEVLQEQLEDFCCENEFMFGGTFYPYIEDDTLKMKVTFREDYCNSCASYDIDWSGIVADFYGTITGMLEKKLGPEFDLDNLDFQMAITSNSESGVQSDSYNLIYSVPESEEVINLSEDKDLKMAAIDYFHSWGAVNRDGRVLLGEELDFEFSIEIEESYISSFIESVYDIINLNLKE